MAEAPSRPIVWQLSGEEEEIEGGMVFLGMKNCERTGGLRGCKLGREDSELPVAKPVS